MNEIKKIENEVARNKVLIKGCLERKDRLTETLLRLKSDKEKLLKSIKGIESDIVENNNSLKGKLQENKKLIERLNEIKD